MKIRVNPEKKRRQEIVLREPSGGGRRRAEAEKQVNVTEIRESSVSCVTVEYVSCEPTDSARELFDEEYGAVEEEE